MTQVSNTKTVFIPPNYLHEEHKNDETHSGYIPFDHKLLLREDIRVPVTGQTTLNLSSILATPNLNELRWQTFDILDDEFIVDLILPYYTVTPYPHGDASTKPYAPFKVREGTANFSEPRNHPLTWRNSSLSQHGNPYRSHPCPRVTLVE
eukprot:CFRG4086T1